MIIKSFCSWGKWFFALCLYFSIFFLLLVLFLFLNSLASNQTLKVSLKLLNMFVSVWIVCTFILYKICLGLILLLFQNRRVCNFHVPKVLKCLRFKCFTYKWVIWLFSFLSRVLILSDDILFVYLMSNSTSLRNWSIIDF